eukprot:SAG22_NODE_21005_length_260_cov_1.614907_1_plen_47_part_01
MLHPSGLQRAPASHLQHVHLLGPEIVALAGLPILLDLGSFFLFSLRC